MTADDVTLPMRLRSLADYATEARPISRLTDEGRKVVRDAADEIDFLRAQLAVARRAFEAIATPPGRLHGGYDHYAMAREVAARAAACIPAQSK